jgi:hypothetical protein
MDAMNIFEIQTLWLHLMLLLAPEYIIFSRCEISSFVVILTLTFISRNDHSAPGLTIAASLSNVLIGLD